VNDPDCNNSADNGDELVLNDNVNFDYSSCCDDVNSPIDMSPPHIPLPMSTACMHIEENNGSVFVVSSSKKDQSPIIFGRVWHWITTSNDSDEDLEPHNSFIMHGQCTIWWKKWDTTYVMVKAWTLERDDVSLYNLLYQKESLPTTTIRLAGSWGILLHLLNLIQNLNGLYYHILQIHRTENLM